MTQKSNGSIATRLMRVGHDVPLISMIGTADQDLMPHFLNHYRKLGFQNFQFILHGEHTPATLNFLTEANGVSIVSRNFDPYSEELKQDLLNQQIARFKKKWVLLVDADEFLELPLQSIKETISWLEYAGLQVLPAYMIQRITEDGSLADLGPDDDIEQLFAHYDFNLSERMEVARPIWKTKFPLFLVDSDTRLQRSNHWPPKGVLNIYAPIRATLSHFKWRSSLHQSLQAVRLGSASNSTEMTAYHTWLDNNDQRVPVFQSRPYSRAQLIDSGFLVVPTKDAANRSAMLSELGNRGSRSKRRSQAARQLKVEEARTQSWASNKAQSEMTSLRNLLLRPGKICFVTFEIDGPSKTGGASTAVSSLMERLAAAGHQVDAIFCPFDDVHELDEIWRDYWMARGVKVESFMRVRKNTGYRPFREFVNSLAEHLESRNYDVVHFDDVTGYGCNIASLRAAGLAFQNTSIVMTTHGSSKWHWVGNLTPWNPGSSEQEHESMRMLRLADAVIHPTSYMRNYVNKHISHCPYQAVLPNILPYWTRSFGTRQRPVLNIREIVFFGRLEMRKGLDIFLRALRLSSQSYSGTLKVTFLGKLGQPLTPQSLREMLSGINAEIKIFTEFDSVAAVNYLKGTDCLAVVPSRQDNLPYTVYECLENQVPIVCSDVGGISELLHKNDRARTMIASDSIKLSKFLLMALQHGVKPARLAFDPEDAALRLLASFAWLVDQGRNPRTRTKADKPRVSACVYLDPTETPRPDLVQQFKLLQRNQSIREVSFFGQQHWNFTEVASDINEFVSKARETFVLLCHGDTVPSDKRIVNAMFQLAQKGQFDAVVCDYRAVLDAKSSGLKTPSGRLSAPAGPPEFSASWKLYGAGIALVRKSAFLDSGGLSLLCDKGKLANWEILNSLAAAGCSIGSVYCPMTVLYIRDTNNIYHHSDHLLLARLTQPWLTNSVPINDDLLRKSAERDFYKCPHSHDLEQQLVPKVTQLMKKTPAARIFEKLIDSLWR